MEGPMASYRCTSDLFLPAPSCIYAQAGDLLSDAVPTPLGYLPIPVGWVPPLAVDPQDTDGIQRFFNPGPTSGMSSAEHGALSTVFSGNRWQTQVVAPPAVYWKPATLNGAPGFVLNGAEGLGFKNEV
jgi:hypothetical protein